MSPRAKSVIFSIIASLFLLIGGGVVFEYVFNDTPVEKANKHVIGFAGTYVLGVFEDMEHKTLQPSPEGDSKKDAGVLVWRGIDAKVIAIIPEKTLLTQKWTVYAQTPRGRYFSATFKLRADADASVQGLARLALSGFSALQEKDVESALLRSGQRDAYEQWFKPANGKEIEA